MLGRFGKDAGSPLGVEIASDSIRMLQVRARQGARKVVAWAREPLETPWRGDWSREAEALVKALRRAHRRSGSASTQVAIALPGSEVICKVHSVPAGLSASQIEERLLSDAQRLFPFPLDDLAMDFHVLDGSPQIEGQMDVLVAACRQRSLDRIEQLLDEAGLQAVAVEVDGIALKRILPMTADSPQALLRLEVDSAALHIWSDGWLPQHREVRFAPAEAQALRLERVVQLLNAGGARLPRLVIAADDGAAPGWTDPLRERLGIPCTRLVAARGLEAGAAPNATQLSRVRASMVLAWGLSLGGIR